MDLSSYNKSELITRALNSIFLILCLLYLFDFFSPKLNSASTVFKAGVSRESSGGLNGRSLFWLIMGCLVYSFSYYRSFFKNTTWFKSYFTLLTILIFVSILWSNVPSTTVTRAFLWLLAGGVITLLYIQESLYGDLKKVIIYLSGILLFSNLIAVIFFSEGAFSHEGAMSGIFLGKNVLGAVAAVFSLMLSALLIEFNFTNHRYKLFIKSMLLVWLVFLFLSSSKSSLAITLLLIPSMLIIKHKIKLIIYFILSLVTIVLCILPIIYKLVGANLFGEYSDSLSPELFTGRGIIWTMILSEFSEFFWFGVGYGGYWVGTVRDVFDFENSFFTVLNSSHNGYLHIITNLGVIGLSVFIGITLFKLAKFGHRLELWELAFLVFISLHAVFETDFFVYKNVWILFCAILSSIEYEKNR